MKLLKLDELSLYLKTKTWSGLREKPSRKKRERVRSGRFIEEFMLDIMYEIQKDSNISSGVVINKSYLEKVAAYGD